MRKLTRGILLVLLILSLAAPAHAAWDATKPADTQKIRLGPADIRANNDALEDALAREHEFPGTLGTTAGRHKFGYGNDAARDAITSWKQGSIWIKSDPETGQPVELQVQKNAAAPFSWETVGKEFPSGTKLIFFQSTCPAGWTQDTSVDDKLILVVDDATGGGTGGTWSQGTHTHTIIDHVHQWLNMVASANQDDQSYNISGQAIDVDRAANNKASNIFTIPVEEYTKGAAEDYYTSSAGAQTSSASGTAATWRPAHIKCIACEKN